MDIIEKIAAAVEETKNTQYTVRDIPIMLSKLDQEINEILEYVINSSEDEQVRIRKSLTVEMSWLLLCFGIRMATYALRLSNQRYFTNGLFAVSMTLGILDKRDILIMLPLYCDVQMKNSLSFGEILKQNNSFATVLKEFINREPEDRSLACMGYVLEIDENNIPTYQRNW